MFKRLIGWARGRSRFNCGDQDSPAWDERARAVVELCRRHLRTDDAAAPAIIVVDLGCGNRRLEPMLKEAFDRRHEYRGYDLCPQSPMTIRIDLERDMPSGAVDVAVVAGVIEYVGDVQAFLRRLSRFATVAVVSYVVFDSPEPLSRKEREDRQWRSHYSCEEFQALLVAAGYEVAESVWVNRKRTVVWLVRRSA